MDAELPAFGAAEFLGQPTYSAVFFLPRQLVITHRVDGVARTPQLSLAPVPHVVGIKRNTKQIRGHEAKLRGAKRNHADDDAVCTGDQPALPKSPSHQDGGQDGKNARNVIQPYDHDYLSISANTVLVEHGATVIPGKRASGEPRGDADLPENFTEFQTSCMCNLHDSRGPIRPQP